MDAPPVALVSLLTTDRRLIYRPVQHLTSCQSGAWVGTKLLDKNIVTGNTTCSSTAMSVATCPSGKTIASGGWRLTWYGSGNNAPDSSYPRNTTQWVTNSNGDNNCFQSVAMCE